MKIKIEITNKLKLIIKNHNTQNTIYKLIEHLRLFCICNKLTEI